MDRSTYEIRLAQWTKIVEECSRRPSEMTVTAWTEEHGIGVKSYYYWQRKVRRAMAQLMQPQLPSVVPEKQVAFAEIECQSSQTPPETLEMFKPDAVLRRGDVLIGISNSVSDSLLRIILENLSHAG